MNNDWYSSGSWYDPLTPAVPTREKKKKRTWLIISGIVLGVLVLIVASSLLTRMLFPSPAVSVPKGSGFELPIPGDGKEDAADEPEMPEDWREFFENYYTGITTDKAVLKLPRAPLPQDYRFAAAAAEKQELDMQELYRRCSPSVVAIAGYVDGKSGYYWGSGVILSADGLVITNTHVIESCDRAEVILSDDSRYEALLVGADSISDIAVLKIEAKGLPAATLGDSSALTVGQRVAAIGNPLSEVFRFTLTDGIISGIERGINANGHTVTLLQTNTAMNEGNSGGPLFNMYGQVIGITNMKMMSSYSSIEGIGFAIPTSTVISVVNALCRDGEVKGRPSVGITVGAIPQNAKEQYGLPDGLYVSAVSAGSDAEAKGIRVGDVVTHVNGQPVTTVDEVSAIKNGLSVGDTMTFTVWREGKTFDVEVTLMDTNDIY